MGKCCKPKIICCDDNFIDCPSAIRDVEPISPGANAFGVTIDNQLISFNIDIPSDILRSIEITCLRKHEEILGIDFRPATGQLYALARNTRTNLASLYIIDPLTGVATPVGTKSNRFSLLGSSFGFDFNPVVDRIRVVSNLGQNLRVDPNTGAIVAFDGSLSYAVGDPNFGIVPSVVASAYTNSFANASSTTLYDIDAAANVLVIQAPPNIGILNTVGSLGVDVSRSSPFSSFDIRNRDNIAFAALTLENGFFGFYGINLATGAATLVSPIPQNLKGFALLP